jgi:hypothetical protein
MFPRVAVILVVAAIEPGATNATGVERVATPFKIVLVI